MVINPLLAALRVLLLDNELEQSEYLLIKSLVAQGVIQPDYAMTSLSLFQTHFLMMNALYQLQREWFGEGIYLHVSPLAVRREKCTFEESKIKAIELSGLSDFYLNWDNLEAATTETVDELIAKFWRSYSVHGIDDVARKNALDVLGLSEPVEYTELKLQYRRLAMIHHPDRGGDDSQLQEINNAMSVLEKCLGR
jgi:hypothetical protein